MTREELIKALELDGITFGGNSRRLARFFKALDTAIELLATDINVGNKLQKTDKYNNMIEAFECDFALIKQGEQTFAELDDLMKKDNHSLAEDMELMQELSFLLRCGKAEIYVRGEEDV